VQLVYLLATAAPFDVWEQRCDCATSGEGKGTDEMDWQVGNACWVAYCTPIKAIT